MASLALDGPMATPTVNYVVRAAAIGFGDTVVEDVYASGLARVDADRILIPIDARARRVSGLTAAAGGRSDARSVGKDGVRTCRSRWAPSASKKKKATKE